MAAVTGGVCVCVVFLTGPPPPQVTRGAGQGIPEPFRSVFPRQDPRRTLRAGGEERCSAAAALPRRAGPGRHRERHRARARREAAEAAPCERRRRHLLASGRRRTSASPRGNTGGHRRPPARPPVLPPSAPPVTFLRRLHGAAERAGAVLRGRRRPLSPAVRVPRRRRGGGQRGSAWHPPGGAAEPRRRDPGRCRPLAASAPRPRAPRPPSRPGGRGRAAPGGVAAPAEAPELAAAAAAAPPGPGHGEEGGCAWGLRRHCPRRGGGTGRRALPARRVPQAGDGGE